MRCNTAATGGPDLNPYVIRTQLSICAASVVALICACGGNPGISHDTVCHLGETSAGLIYGNVLRCHGTHWRHGLYERRMTTYEFLKNCSRMTQMHYARHRLLEISGIPLARCTLRNRTCRLVAGKECLQKLKF